MAMQRPKMLISDDDFDLRESLGAVFSARGLETRFAGDGREAFEIVCNENIHLVLIDFHMPRMTGLEALRLIKDYRQELPVILMSAEIDDAMTRDIEAADAFSVHRKPVNIQQIRDDVAAALKSIYDWPANCQ